MEIFEVKDNEGINFNYSKANTGEGTCIKKDLFEEWLDMNNEFLSGHRCNF